MDEIKLSDASTTEKQCAKCGAVKPLDQFHLNPKMRLNRHSYCKDCIRKINAKKYSGHVLYEMPELPFVRWAVIAHVPNRPGYACTDDGRVFTCRTKNGCPGFAKEWRQVKWHLTRAYYKSVHAHRASGSFRANYPIHQLVLETFVGPRGKDMVSRHLDGNPFNNHLSNLSWGTYQENSDDTKRHGRSGLGKKRPELSMPGQANPSAKLTEDQVRQMRLLYEQGHSQRAIAKRFSVSRSTAYRTVNRRTWVELQ